MARRNRRKRMPVRSMRWLILGVALLIGFLYYRPLSTYLETKQELERRTAELRDLKEDRAALERRLAGAEEPASVERQARRLGLVRPGERLFIITGVDAWRRTQRHR
jgi:cell division protein FtsB